MMSSMMNDGKSEETTPPEVNRKLAKQLRTLNEIARKQNIPVLIYHYSFLST